MKKTVNLRTLLLGGMAAFVLIMLAVLWLCQVVFLDDLYHFIKKREIKAAANTVLTTVKTEIPDDNDLLVIGEKYEVCIEIYLMDTGALQRLASADVVPRCALHATDLKSKFTIFSEAEKNGGTYLEYFSFDPQKRLYRSVGGKPEDAEEDLSMIYAVIGEQNGKTLLMIFNSSVTPISATVSTLYVLLSIFTVVILLLAVIYTHYLSKTIAAPIDRLTAAAETLGTAENGSKFSVTGYTEIEKLSNALGYASSEISKTETLRRDFLANVTHDLKTPITLIAGYSEMMLDFPEENTPENLENIVNETKRLSYLVNEVLDYSKLVSGTVVFEPKPYNITAQLRDITERYAEMLRKDGFELTFQADRDAVVCADAQQIARAVINYITNAVSHSGANDKTNAPENAETPENRIIITQTVDADWVTVSVTDFGHGIPKEELSEIWERYYKVGKNNSLSARGSGLGLSIVKTIMERSGGAYGVRSTVGKGSTFWLALPNDEKVQKLH